MTSPSDNRPENRKNRLSEYADQCYLMDFIDHFSGMKGDKIAQNYQRFGMVNPEKSNSTIFLNELLQTENGQLLLEKLPKTLAGDLQPYVRLYLSVGSGNNEKLMLLPFNNFENIDSLTRPMKPGLGVGLKSFSFDYLGNAPVEVDYWINCEFNLYFESPQALFHKYQKDGLVYSFADLIKRTKNYKQSDPALASPDLHLQFDPANFRIRVEVGYKPPSERVIRETTNLNPIEATQLRKALVNARISFYLTLLKHTVKPRLDDPSGAFEMTITYNGALESTFLSSKTNILISETLAGISTERQKLKRSMDEARRKAMAQLQSKGVTEAKLESLDDITSYEGTKSEKVGGGSIRDAGGTYKTVTVTDVNKIMNDLGVTDVTDTAKRQAGATVIEYMKEKKNYNDLIEETQSQKDQELISIYGRMLRTLVSKAQVYKIKVEGDSLLKWQKARESYDILTEAQVRDLKEAVANSSDPLAAQNAQEKLNENQKNQGALSLLKQDQKEKLQVNNLERNFTDDKGKLITDEYPGKLLKEVENYINEKNVEKNEDAIQDLEELNRDKELSSGDDRDIYWFYYGDLLDSALEILEASRSELDLDLWTVNSLGGKIKVLLGDIDYIDPETGKIKKINIARVPIALNTYAEWWTNKVIKPLKEKYVFKAFLRDSITSLVKNALTNRCRRGGQPALKVQLATDFISLDETKPINFEQEKKAGEKDQSYYFTSYKQTMSIEAANKLAAGYRTGDLMFVYAPSNQGTFLDEHRKEEDVKRGIYHFVLGKEDTPLINVNFNKNDQPYFLEAKAEHNGILDDTVQLSEPYHCDMTLYGNATFRPGRLVHVRFPVTWFGYPSDPNAAAKILGLGGYFHINKASNQIKLMGSKLEWTTDLTMLWQTFGKENKTPKANISTTTLGGDPTERPRAGRTIQEKNEKPC